MRAIVTSEFSALPPGEKRNRVFRVGEEVTGELAMTAIDNGFAEALAAPALDEPGSPEQPRPLLPFGRGKGKSKGGRRSDSDEGQS